MTLNAGALLAELRADNSRLALPGKGEKPSWDQDGPHKAAYEKDPELYALGVTAEGVPAGARARALFQILRRSREGLAAGARRTLDRVAAYLLVSLPAPTVLAVFQGLRRVGANHKHATRAIVEFVFAHPSAVDMVSKKRKVVTECLEHAVGRDVARGCARKLEAGESGAVGYWKKSFGRFLADADAGRELLPFVYGKAKAPSRDEEPHALVHRRYEPATVEIGAPKTVTATNRGDVSATLVHVYRGGENRELSRWLEGYVARAASGLPRFEGTLAIVLDASASTRGYGEREFCCISQSYALALVLEKCAEDVLLFTVGGRGSPPAPEGATDLAGAVLDAASGNPDVVAVLTDGYENTLDGDLARVTRALGKLEQDVPVVVLNSAFTRKDDLSLRSPAPELPSLTFWHESEFAELATGLFGYARGELGVGFARRLLSDRLSRIEKEVKPWIAST